MNDLVPLPPPPQVLDGEISHCICDAPNDANGHSFACILAQIARRKVTLPAD